MTLIFTCPKYGNFFELISWYSYMVLTVPKENTNRIEKFLLETAIKHRNMALKAL